MRAGPEKVSAVLHWPTVSNCCQLQKILGFANFYCEFIKRYTVV